VAQLRQVAIIGAGVAGLTAAYELTRQKHPVTVFETAPQVGGLASGFRAPEWEWPLERFYHHWFASDDAIIGLIDELGLRDRLFFPRPITSIWHTGKAHPFDSPLAALRFPHLSWPAKVRFGIVGLYLRLARNWKPLERYTAHEWCLRWMGREAYETLWQPLLIGKFGRYYQEVNMAWFWARLHKRTPRLGYFVGGFQGFANALADRVRAQGGTIRLTTPVDHIAPVPQGGVMVRAAGQGEQFDTVIATVGPGLMAQLAPDLPSGYLDRLRQLKSMGAIVLILSLKRQLMTDGTYWLNLPARSPDKKENEFPFLALVEHTNYLSREHYNNEHLVYCGDYLPPEHEYFRMSQEELLDTFLPALRKVNPAFDPSWVQRSWLFREQYAQPIPPINHSRNIPDIRTPIPGLYLASMSQVYPWDRGTNYAVEIGRQVAAMVRADAERQGKQ